LSGLHRRNENAACANTGVEASGCLFSSLVFPLSFFFENRSVFFHHLVGEVAFRHAIAAECPLEEFRLGTEYQLTELTEEVSNKTPSWSDTGSGEGI